MFWNSDRIEDYGRWMKLSDRTGDDALVRFDGRWASMSLPSDTELVKLDDAAIAGISGLEAKSFETMVKDGAHKWRNSPSSSVFNISMLADKAVQPGKPMFLSLTRQTQLITALFEAQKWQEEKAVTYPLFQAIKGSDGKRGILMVRGATAMTATEEGTERLNEIAYAFWLREQVQQAKIRTGMIKLPKVLYRGIRTTNLSNDLKVPEHLAKLGHNHHMNWLIPATAAKLVSDPLAELTGSSIMSFSSNRAIAELFTGNEGFIVEIDPREHGIVTSHLHDEPFNQVDAILRRKEKEWIVRISDDFIVPRQNVDVHHRDWFELKGDPRGISTIHHYDEAEYTLNGLKIIAFWQYNSNGVGGMQRFHVPNGMTFSRRGFKQAYGVDPVPEPGAEVVGLKFFDGEFMNRRKRQRVRLEGGLFDLVDVSCERDAEATLATASP